MQAILDWVGSHAAYAGPIIFFISFLESLALVGIIVPGMLFMLGIGTLVGIGVLPFWSTIVWATLGAVAGDAISYWLGRHYQQRLQHVWPLSRYPGLIVRGEQFFHKHGELSILIGRFVGPLRAIVPAIAGMMEMSPRRFFLMNVVSAIAWAPVVVIPGAVFGAATQLASEVALRLLLLVAALLLGLWFFSWCYHRLLRLCAQFVNTRWRIPNRFTYIFGYISLILLFIIIPVTFLTEKSAEISRTFSQNQWWQDQWQSLYRNNSQYNIQFYGDLSVLRDMPLAGGWYQPEALQIGNVLKWLVPNSLLQDLPLYLPDSKGTQQTWSVANRYEGSLHEPNHSNAATTSLMNSILLISIKIDEADCIGFGQISRIRYRPWFLGLGLSENRLETKIDPSIVATLGSVDGIEVAIKNLNNAEVLLVRTTETLHCETKNY
ncbi:MAG: DedA family protein [Thiohalomonadales bacterium]